MPKDTPFILKMQLEAPDGAWGAMESICLPGPRPRALEKGLPSPLPLLPTASTSA